jgi:hypothetical protein
MLIMQLCLCGIGLLLLIFVFKDDTPMHLTMIRYEEQAGEPIKA